MARHVDISEAMQKWQPARLIPTTGLRGQHEQETRATSVLLAVMHVVPEFAGELLGYGKAPAGKYATYETFTEVTLQDAVSGDKVRPDGAIVVRRGKKVWRCLVEVKTGRATLSTAQVEQYVRVANQMGFDAVFTVSNEIASRRGQCPVGLDKRTLRNITLFHVSWFRVLTEAVLAHVHRGVSDPEQAWILAELMTYLRHPQSGAGDFEDLGKEWTKVRDGGRNKTLRANDPAVREIAANWEQFVQYLCLQLCQHLGRDVDPIYPRKLDKRGRLAQTCAALAETGTLTGSIKVPDAVGPVTLEIDLQARMVTIGTDVKAPDLKRPATRVSWMLRQLKEAPENLRIEAVFPHVRQPTASLLSEVRAEPSLLTFTSDPKRGAKQFRLALGRRMGMKRGRKPGSFVAETETQLLDFYGQVVQGIKKWTPPAPQMRTEPEVDVPEGVQLAEAADPTPVETADVSTPVRASPGGQESSSR